MPAGKGRTKDKYEIRTEHGCIIKFKNNLKPGTKIWIFYDDNMDIKKIEEFSNKYSPQFNPSPHKTSRENGGGE